jgi:dTDP-4-dehydrorhamnose 3,5-epimerase
VVRCAVADMRIVAVENLVIPEVKVVRYARFSDARGYFSETFRRGIVDSHPALEFLRDVQLPQTNESFSRAGVIRGLHFQWGPPMGKFIRTVHGRMVDIFLDVRLGSPTFGKVAMYEMASPVDQPYGEWIWVPPGFAHGNFFSADTHIQYMCTEEWKPGSEGGVSPLAPDLDWSLCDPALRAEFDALVAAGPVIADKDRNAPSLSEWQGDPRAQNFIYAELVGQASTR